MARILTMLNLKQILKIWWCKINHYPFYFRTKGITRMTDLKQEWTCIYCGRVIWAKRTNRKLKK